MTSLQEDLNTFHIQRVDLPDFEDFLADTLPSTETEASATENSSSPEEVDLKQLAQKVYALLKKELRIEQERRPRHKAFW